MKRLIDGLVDYMPLVLLVFLLSICVISVTVSYIIEQRTAMTQGYVQQVSDYGKVIWVKPETKTTSTKN